MKQLQITIEIDELNEDELTQAGYATELEYWMNLVYADPHFMLDKAVFQIISNQTLKSILRMLKETRAASDMSGFWATISKLEALAECY